MSVGYGSEVLAVVGRIFYELGEYLPRLREEVRLTRFARSLKSELLAKPGVGVRRGLLEHGNGLRIELHAPIEVRRGTHYAEYFGILTVKRLHISLRGGEILTRFVQMGECVAQLQPRDWIRSQGRLLFQGMLPHGFQGFLLGEILDFCGLLDGRDAADHGVQEGHQLRFAVLYFEDTHAQENSRHGSASSGHRLLR